MPNEKKCAGKLFLVTKHISGEKAILEGLLMDRSKISWHVV
jgi:hypothetical protein